MVKESYVEKTFTDISAFLYENKPFFPTLFRSEIPEYIR